MVIAYKIVLSLGESQSGICLRIRQETTRRNASTVHNPQDVSNTKRTHACRGSEPTENSAHTIPQLSVTARPENVSTIAQLSERYLQLGTVAVTQRHLDGVHCRHRPHVLDSLALLVHEHSRPTLKRIAIAVELLAIAIKPSIGTAAIAQIITCDGRRTHAIAVNAACDGHGKDTVAAEGVRRYRGCVRGAVGLGWSGVGWG